MKMNMMMPFCTSVYVQVAENTINAIVADLDCEAYSQVPPENKKKTLLIHNLSIDKITSNTENRIEGNRRE